MQPPPMALVTEYHLLIMTVGLALLVLAAKKKPDNRVLVILTVLLAGSIIYEVVADEPLSQVAVRITRALNQPGPTESTNPHYYALPEERTTNPAIQKYLPKQ